MLKLLDNDVVKAGKTRRETRQQMVLVHDRATFHKSKQFNVGAAELGWETVLLPAKGCDISPLDTSYFGVAKQRWLTEYRWKLTDGCGPTWEQLCHGFVHCLKQTEPDQHIRSIPGRIARCINARGGHIH